MESTLNYGPIKIPLVGFEDGLQDSSYKMVIKAYTPWDGSSGSNPNIVSDEEWANALPGFVTPYGFGEMATHDTSGNYPYQIPYGGTQANYLRLNFRCDLFDTQTISLYVWYKEPEIGSENLYDICYLFKPLSATLEASAETPDLAAGLTQHQTIHLKFVERTNFPGILIVGIADIDGGGD